MKVIRIEKGRRLQFRQVLDRYSAVVERNEAVAPEILKRTVDVHVRKTERIAQGRLGYR